MSCKNRKHHAASRTRVESAVVESPQAVVASRSAPSAPELAPFVSCFWSYEGYAAPHARERLLPTGNMGLFFTLDAEGGVAAGVSGASSEAVMLDTSRPFSIIGVEFKAGGGFPFLADPVMHSITAALRWTTCGAPPGQVSGIGCGTRPRRNSASAPSRRRCLRAAAIGWRPIARCARLLPHSMVHPAPVGSTKSWPGSGFPPGALATCFDRRSDCRQRRSAGFAASTTC